MNMFKLNAFKNSNSSQAEQPKSKAEITRAQILGTALGLFREKGFDTTTMRDIASACGMAVGTAYHHFESKEAIVAAYYEAVQLKHSLAVAIYNQEKHSLKQKLEQAFFSKLEIVQHDQKLLGVIMRYVGDSEHPLSIFGQRTRHLRQAGTDIFMVVLKDEKLSEHLDELAPTAFWTLQMGMLLYFLHDQSNGEKTKKLVSGALDLTLQLLKLSSQPLIQPFARPVFQKVSALLRKHELI
jgi:AcrR family transcriptional regulator